jgi:hypothetical protein
MAEQVAQRFGLLRLDLLRPASVQPIPAKRPCLWHYGQKRQGGGIPRRAGGIRRAEQSERLSWDGLHPCTAQIPLRTKREQKSRQKPDAAFGLRRFGDFLANPVESCCVSNSKRLVKPRRSRRVMGNVTSGVNFTENHRFEIRSFLAIVVPSLHAEAFSPDRGRLKMPTNVALGGRAWSGGNPL